MKIIKIVISMVLCVHLTGCEDFLEVDTPKDQIDRQMIFSDDRMAAAAVSNIYTQLRSGGFLAGNRVGIGYLFGCYTDELEVVNPQLSSHRSFYENAVLSTNTAVKDLWTAGYQQVFAVNSILEGLEASSAVSADIKNQLKGEALAIRAVIHLYLVQTFGSVPYIKTTDYNLNRVVAKDPVNVVMKNVMDDLLNAENLLTVNYPSVEKVRINQTVVKAFLARACLYSGDWQNAEGYAAEVIAVNNNMEPVSSRFLKESKSALWQLKPETDGKNTAEAIEYIFQTLPAPQSKIATALLNVFEPDDLRKKSWLKFVGDDGLNACAYKYKIVGNSAPSQEYSVILRTEEMFLIVAECAAERSDWDTFNTMINKVRSSAGLSDLNLQNKEEAVNAVLQERRVEFFCEFGHRFFDLKRRNRLETLKTVKNNWQSYYHLLPLPESELLLNQNLLPQNTGY